MNRLLDALFQLVPEGPHLFPDDVLTAIHSGSNDDASTLTDNALRLLGAWGELTADDLSADIALSADCGPIVLDEDHRAGQFPERGQ